MTTSPVAARRARDRVGQIVTANPDEALRAARAIEHPWYRCQALAQVAESTADDARARAIANEALRAAQELTEPNRIVTVASWPIRVIVKRRLADVAAEIERLLGIIDTEPHSLRRAHALFSLAEAVFGDRALRHRVLGALRSSLAASHGWRAERLWGFTALLMAGESAEAAHEIFVAMPEGKAKRQIAKQLASPQYVGPRWIEFFRPTT